MNLLISLDKHSKLGLQQQIRQQMVAAILSGAVPTGQRIISSRKLSEQLNVARNTVTLAYNQLIDEGYLISFERKGLFVNESILNDRGAGIVTSQNKTTQADSSQAKMFWQQKIKNKPHNSNHFHYPSDWDKHPYPFIDGVFDRSLYPVKQWQEASRLAFSNVNTQHISSFNEDDDSRLIEEIRTKILPRRGINAQSKQILLTSGSQHALFLLVQLLCNKKTIVALEEPGSIKLRNSLELTQCTIHPQKVDENGMIIDKKIAACQLIFVTPSHQNPTAVTMSQYRREKLMAFAKKHQQVIIEDDSDCERNYFGNPQPALRSMDDSKHVIYVSAIPKAIAPGLDIGFIVADSELIKQAKHLRQLMLGNSNKSIQRTAAFFLFLGYYDAFLMKANKIFQRRWNALRDALNHYLPNAIITMPNQGGTAFWVKCPENIHIKQLVSRAAKQGVLIEPVKDYYYKNKNYKADHSQACFRMGVTSIDENKIRAGVAKLAKLIREFSGDQNITLDSYKHKPLNAKKLFKKLAGATLICQTVYGEPCQIVIRADGKLIGQAGFDNEDQDAGHWWIEEGCWFRQWHNWSYGEQAGFFVIIDEQQISWFNQNGRLVDTAIIQCADNSSNNQLV
jgi:GntR family transcriptional regulator/MocR family aminotransferase